MKRITATASAALCVNLLHTITSFETFDTLAGERDITEVTLTIQMVARLVATSAARHRTALRPA